MLSAKAALADYESVRKDSCAPNTRKHVLETIRTYLTGHPKRFVWLRGSPGTGKTAVAKTIAKEFGDPSNQLLCASFFFDKHSGAPGGNVIDINLFPPTIALQLANFDPMYAEQLALAVNQDPLILFKPLKDQMKRLIIEPLCKPSTISLTHQRVYIVLDGLDECLPTEVSNKPTNPLDRSVDPLSELMDLIFTLDACPWQLRILMCCRPEHQVRDHVDLITDTQSRPVVEDMNDMKEQDDDEDVFTMVKWRLDIMPRKGKWSPTEKDAKDLSGTCGRLMLLADIRLRRIEKDAKSASLRSAFLGVLGDARRVGGDLNGEYHDIIRQAYNDVQNEVTRRYYKVMSMHLATDRNWGICIDCLAFVANIDVEDAEMALRRLGSVLDADMGQPIRFYHATFKEFTLAPPREGSPAWVQNLCLGGRGWEFDVADTLLSYLNDKLRRNVLDLQPVIAMFETDQALSVSDEVLLTDQAKSLSWAMSCLGFILASLVNSASTQKSTTSNMWNRLEEFINKKVLFGLEILIPCKPLYPIVFPHITDLS